MNASMMNAENYQLRVKVSILIRLLAAFCYAIPLIGGALSSFLLIRVIEAIARAENAGIVALMKGVEEASLPLTVSLYLAAFFGVMLIIVLAIRLTTETKTASPPIWFLVLGGIFSLIPAAFFWYAKYLIIEVLSPGSSLNNTGNFGSIGASISEILLLSVFSAPLIGLLLLVASVIPFSSSSKTHWLSFAGAVIVEILLIGFAVAMPFLINEPQRKNQLVNLPEVRFAEADANIDKESAMVLTLTADNKLYERQRADKELRDIIINKGELSQKITKSMGEKSPENQIVYLKVDENASYENVVQIFEIIRIAEVEKVGLAVIEKKNPDDPYQITSRRIELKLPQPKKTREIVKPNPLVLLISMLDKDGGLMLNRESMGTISDTKRLENGLAGIFKARESNGVFRVGTNEIEKEVFLKVSKSVKYGDFIKLVEAVKIAGAEPIAIQIDELNL
ncbi:MAG TPA: biopolymer transporter ExbD [Pyrinomonadaceae bacterium]|nr:biopolymer transporter ExbD [Pyrinomonadaceae bacterium]